MGLSKAEEAQLGRILRDLCADGFIYQAKELASLSDAALKRRLAGLRAVEEGIAISERNTHAAVR